MNIHIPTVAESDAALKVRLLEAKKLGMRTYAIPDSLVPVVRSLIRKGESKKKICLLFGITYQQLKSQLHQLNG